MPKATKHKTEKTNAENFDLYNITETLANHLTDEIYKSLVKDKETKNDLSDNLDSALHKSIGKELIPEITKIVGNQVKDRLRAELKEQYHANKKYESFFDTIISGSRWMMALVYSSMTLVLAFIFLYTIIDIVYLGKTVWNDFYTFFCTGSYPEKGSMQGIIGPAVKLMDLVLIGSLVVMVLIGGYENTVSRIGMKHSMPTWLGKLSITGLKVKVAASIVVISSIHLLMAFLTLNFSGNEKNIIDNDISYYYPLIFTAVIHFVFVASAIFLAKMAILEKKAH